MTVVTDTLKLPEAKDVKAVNGTALVTNWGFRGDSVDSMAERLHSYIQELAATIPGMTTTWAAPGGVGIDTSLEGLRAHINISHMDAEDGSVYDNWFSFSIRNGDWWSRGAENRDLATMRIQFSDARLEGWAQRSSMVTFDVEGPDLPAEVSTARTELVKMAARVWQPRTAVHVDNDSIDSVIPLRDQLADRGRGMPQVGYSMWFSDEIAENLTSLEGATVTRYGEGWLIETDGGPEEVGQLWSRLHADPLLGRASDTQHRIPTFD